MEWRKQKLHYQTIDSGSRRKGDFIMNTLLGGIPVAVATIALTVVPALAQTKSQLSEPSEKAGAPSESALTVGALRIGAAANLEVSGFDISVTTKSVAYSYQIKNTGTTELAVAATVALPYLRASADGSETWTLFKNDPENYVDLAVSAGGTPVTTKAETHATALGVDRLAEIKADQLPLIPFGAETNKALAALSPESAERLAALGVTSPRDLAKPKATIKPDWSLDVVHSWRQTLPPGKITPIVIKFVPVVAKYRLMKGDEEELDDMKAAICLKPQVLSTLQSRLKGGGVWNVTEISLADDAPGWIDSPAAMISVQKPKSDAMVAFCGMDEKTAGKSAVLGVAPDDNDGIRIVIFEPAAK
jgi:hypothetical protein